MRAIRSAAVCAAALLLGACASGEPESAAESETDLIARAQGIHERAITIDTHDDIPPNFATPEVDPLDADRQVTLEKMRAGGLDAGFFVVYAGQTARTPENYAIAKAEAMTKFEAIHRMTRRCTPTKSSSLMRRTTWSASPVRESWLLPSESRTDSSSGRTCHSSRPITGSAPDM